MTPPKPKTGRRYAIARVESCERPDTFELTITKDGVVVGRERVRTFPAELAYFNHGGPPSAK